MLKLLENLEFFDIFFQMREAISQVFLIYGKYG